MRRTDLFAGGLRADLFVGSLPGPAAVLAGWGAGQLQEDIVQRGPAQPDVADADLCPAQPGGRLLHQQEPVAGGREGEPVRALVRLRLAAAHPGEPGRALLPRPSAEGARGAACSAREAPVLRSPALVVSPR